MQRPPVVVKVQQGSMPPDTPKTPQVSSNCVWHYLSTGFGASVLLCRRCHGMPVRGALKSLCTQAFESDRIAALCNAMCATCPHVTRSIKCRYTCQFVFALRDICRCPRRGSREGSGKSTRAMPGLWSAKPQSTCITPSTFDSSSNCLQLASQGRCAHVMPCKRAPWKRAPWGSYTTCLQTADDRG
jgi:hypothetical protein